MGAPARVPQSGTRPRQIQTQLQLFPQPAQPLQYRFCSRRTGSKVPPFTSRSHVHTQRFAFRAPEVHDESVKMSSTTVGRSSALPPALQAARPCAADDATSIVILPALSDFCEGRPAPLLHAGRSLPAAGRDFSRTSAPPRGERWVEGFLCVLCASEAKAVAVPDFPPPLRCALCAKSFGFLRTFRPQKHQFLFDTNELFLRNTNFATHTKHSTSLFLFDANERPPITNHRSRITDHESLQARSKS